MLYPYITNNNFENRQDYMYSVYSGEAFLEQYARLRMDFLKQAGKSGGRPETGEKDLSHTYHCLEELGRNLDRQGLTQVTKRLLDLFVRTFEVRKRLYDDYTGKKCKPVKGAGYGGPGRYLLFADLLIKGYDESGCLKYLSCLLKLDDTLLSCAEKMSRQEALCFGGILHKEIEAVRKIADQAGCEVRV